MMSGSAGAVESHGLDYLQHLRVGVFIYRDGRFVFRNRHLARIHGCDSREEGWPASSPLRDQTLLSRMDQLLSGSPHGDQSGLPLRIQGLDNRGGVLWIEVAISTIGHEGRPAVLGQVMDVTEGVRAREALRRAEHRYGSFLDDLTDIAYEVDAEGCVTYANPMASRLLGRPLDEIVGSPLLGLMAAESQAEASEFLSTSLSGEGAEAELTLVSGHCCHFKSRPHRDAGGRADGFRGIARDVSRRNQMERQLLNSKAMLQAVFDGISDPLVLLDEDLTVRMLNRAAKDYYGVAWYGDVIGKPCWILRKEGRVDAECEHCRVRQSMSQGRMLVFERKSPFVPNRDEEVFLYPLTGSAEAAERVIVRINDITELKAATREVIHRQKLESLGVLVSGIAHEINNPNNFISFNLPILREYLDAMMPFIDAHAAGAPGMEWAGLPYGEYRKDLFKLLDNIQHGSERIGAIASDLRAFCRKEGELQGRLIHLPGVIEKALSLARGSLTQCALTTEVSIAEGMKDVRGYPEALEQVLVNLLINAAQAADKERSRVEIRACMSETEPQTVVIEVEDNGMGMDPEVRDQIFDPFFTTKARQEGTGLGLYVCRNLVMSMGGRIEVESTPGAGSCFRILIPQMDASRLHSLDR